MEEEEWDRMQGEVDTCQEEAEVDIKAAVKAIKTWEHNLISSKEKYALSIWQISVLMVKIAETFILTEKKSKIQKVSNKII